MFTRLQRKRFSDEIADQVLTLIKKGKLRPGDRLPSEREMSQMLGVSGPPLREGLKMLEAQGFIDIRPRRKTIVKSIADPVFYDPLAKAIEDDAEMVVQLLQVRKIFESWAASEASRVAGQADLEELETLYRQLEKDVVKNQLGVEADVRFHLSIIQATHNTILSHIASTLLDLLSRAQKLTREIMFQEEENRQRLLRQHFAIFDAIRSRDPDSARSAILTHLDFAEKDFVRLASQRTKEEGETLAEST